MKNIKANNFDLVRLIAALQVVFAHATEYIVLGSNSIITSLWPLLSCFPGVPVFFLTSGFLISASYERQNNILSYFKNRMLRIYPALWLSFLVSLLLIGLTGYWFKITISIKAFFAWVLAQITIAQFYNPSFLRGFGVGILNGSLWTITIELQFYLLIPILYYFLNVRLLKIKNRSNVFLLLLIAIFIFINFYFTNNYQHDRFLHKILHISFFPYLYQFLIGIFLQRNIAFFQRFIENKFLIYCIAYYVLCYFLHDYISIGNNPNFLITIFLSFVILSFAFSFRQLSHAILRNNDVSYGIYLYHMIIINIYVQLGHRGHFKEFIEVFILTAAFAILSWFCVEKPAMKLKNYSFRRTPLDPVFES